MIWAVLGSVRPSVIAGAWVAYGAGADWLPFRLLIALGVGLLAGTTAKAVRAADEHDKAMLIRTVVRLTRELDLQPVIRRVKLSA